MKRKQTRNEKIQMQRHKKGNVRKMVTFKVFVSVGI